MAVLDAAADLALGTACVPTIDAVASRAGVSRTTIYKWWPSSAAVLAEALLERFHESIEFDDGLAVRDALTLQVDALVRLLRDTPAGALLRQLLAAAASDERLGRALLAQWMDPRRESAVHHVRRGIEQGDLRADVDADLVVDALFAPVYHRLVWGHAPLDAGLAQQVCDLVWPGIAASRTAT
ncbi:TetR/AcrR family transcriptional regulator [Xylanimonas allomyrinae]|uniref:TetR/AcrR family transcriptional regulator n=1 Tax=Xylanimonas allomyrinae TaxID=2509459 RepID=A0A4P6EN83_9MICO|nr:TetR/AcrR family transcriptional regulator [Xylanimonas allomyrinae]QAY63935.1 TetR/AcrR family transcriptional regulator [Xylanimonas allomyrinae]